MYNFLNLTLFIIFSAEYSFPYVKKRLRVVERSESELTPIETAIDEMRQRVSELEDVVFSLPTDVKKLQLRLQVKTYLISLDCM